MEKEEVKDVKKVFVVNKSGQDVSEYKPEIGNFTVPANGKLEIKDAKKDFKTPDGKVLQYVHTSAKDLADSIVRDFGRSDVLSVEDEDGKEKEKEKEVKGDSKEDKSLFSKDKK